MSIFPTTILLATDGSKEAELAARTAVDISTSTNSELHVVTVARLEYPHAYDIPESGDFQRSAYQRSAYYRAIERNARELLDEQEKKLEQTGVTILQAHLLRGPPDREIVHLADEIGAGLIVIGSRGQGGVRRALMGSVSDSVVRHAHCPVLIVREEKR
jgi:nucleotide-binding universal stress UspA family protein